MKDTGPQIRVRDKWIWILYDLFTMRRARGLGPVLSISVTFARTQQPVTITVSRRDMDGMNNSRSISDLAASKLRDATETVRG
jgi:hypothetical protein